MTEDLALIDELDRLFVEPSALGRPVIVLPATDRLIFAASLAHLGHLVAPIPMVPPFLIFDFDDVGSVRDSFYQTLAVFDLLRCRRRKKRNARIVANETLFGEKVPRPSRGWRKHQRKAKGKYHDRFR